VTQTVPVAAASVTFCAAEAVGMGVVETGPPQPATMNEAMAKVAESKRFIFSNVISDRVKRVWGETLPSS
jgi:hypothetical protein